MPATRRNPTKTTGPAASGAQSRLSFGSRSKITKPSLPAQPKKKDPAVIDAVIEAVTRTPTPECASTARVGEVAQEQPKGEVVKPHKTKEEEDAAAVPEAQVKRYWTAVENERKAPRG
jgi:DNA polymerase delta subunit 4